MATIHDVSQLVDKKGGRYVVIAPKLEPRKFNKWKKRMLCYLARIKPYYLKCIKDGPFQPKTAEGDAKPESQLTLDERRMVVQDQRLKSIIIFKGPSDTKENKIMDLKLEYQNFKEKSTESLSQAYTRYKTLLNELANDGVNHSKHEINVVFVNSLPEKWLTFSLRLRNANHTQTLDLADIYGSSAISIAFFSNNVIQDLQENSKDEVDERSSKEYLRDLDVEYQERALLANSKHFIKRRNNFSASKGFQPKFTPKLIQSSPNLNSQTNPMFQKDYKAEYKKMKAKLALLEASPSKATQVKVLMALADDELIVGKNHARNGEWVDITMRKIKNILSMDEDADWQDYLKYINIDLKFVEEQRLNLLSKYNKIVFELKKCRDELLSLKQAKLDVGASLSSEVMPLTFQPYSPKERPGLGIMKHKKPETHDSSNKSVSGTITISETKQITPSVPTEVKDTEQESKLNELTKLVEMLIDEKQGTILNANKEIVLIAPRRNDVYVIDMSSLTPNGACFFAKASESINWLWHKRLSHLNFKNINKLSKQNKVFGLLSLVISKDKPCTTCEKGKHHRASFKTKQNFSIRKCLHLLPIDLFGPVSLLFINHEKYTLVIVDEDSRVYNTRRQQIKETYHVIFYESMEAIRFTNTLVDEIETDDSSRYPPDEFQEDDPFRQYQVDSDVSHYIIPHRRSLAEINQENHVPEDRWSRDQHIKLVNIIGNLGEGMLTRSMATKLIDASASGCLFANCLSEIEPKKVSKALKHPEWINAMQEKLNKFYRNKVWTLVPFLYGKIAIGSKWVFRNKKDKHGTTIKNKAKLVTQGYSQEEGIDYDETFALVARMEAIRIFFAFSTYVNFKFYQMDVKSAFMNGKLKEEVYVKQPPSFKSSEFPDYVYKLDKALYGLKQAPRAWSIDRFQFNLLFKLNLKPSKKRKAEKESVSKTGAARSYPGRIPNEA
nr:retrovirus-related Pol polyprotein from transposon TNT 1-94 [Tanacetum cinerariifolium]